MTAIQGSHIILDETSDRSAVASDLHAYPSAMTVTSLGAAVIDHEGAPCPRALAGGRTSGHGMGERCMNGYLGDFMDKFVGCHSPAEAVARGMTTLTQWSEFLMRQAERQQALLDGEKSMRRIVEFMTPDSVCSLVLEYLSTVPYASLEEIYTHITTQKGKQARYYRNELVQMVRDNLVVETTFGYELGEAGQQELRHQRCEWRRRALRAQASESAQESAQETDLETVAEAQIIPMNTTWSGWSNAAD